MRRLFLERYVVFGITTLIFPIAHATDETTFSFGIAPQQTASELGKRWIPILNYLSQESGIKLQFKTEKDIPTYQRNIGNDLYDFAYINPYHYTVLNKQSGCTAFAKEADGILEGIIVVNKDADITKPEQLANKTIALPSPNAFAANWSQLRFLGSKNITVTPSYVNSLDSVYRSVAKGMFVVGGGVMRTFSMIDEEVKRNLTVLWKSNPMPPFAFCVSPRVPAHTVEKLQKAMIEMNSTKTGLTLLKEINFSGFEAANDRDYNQIRELDIQMISPK